MHLATPRKATNSVDDDPLKTPTPHDMAQFFNDSEPVKENDVSQKVKDEMMISILLEVTAASMYIPQRPQLTHSLRSGRLKLLKMKNSSIPLLYRKSDRSNPQPATKSFPPTNTFL